MGEYAIKEEIEAINHFRDKTIESQYKLKRKVMNKLAEIIERESSDIPWSCETTPNGFILRKTIRRINVEELNAIINAFYETEGIEFKAICTEEDNGGDILLVFNKKPEEDTGNLDEVIGGKPHIGWEEDPKYVIYSGGNLQQ